MEQLGKLMLVAPEASQEISQILERRSKSSASLSQTSPESADLSWYAMRLQKLRLQRGLPARDLSEIRLIASAWLEELTDIPSEHREEVFNRATANYVDVEVPFGTQQLREAWFEIKNEMRSEVMKAETEIIVADMRVMAECEHESDFHPRTEDDPLLIRGYHICRHCDRAIPVMEKTSKTAKQIAYLTAAISADVA